MKKATMVLVVLVLLGGSAVSFGSVEEFMDVLAQPKDYMSENLFEPQGLTFDLSMTHIYQQNIRGGTSTHNRAGRYSGSYDLEFSGDFGQIVGLESSGNFYLYAEGSWSQHGGIDGPSVGSTFGVNADGVARQSMQISEFWYETEFMDEDLTLRIGKLDITGGFKCRGCPLAFDGNRYANDETSQFLNNSFVNNPTIPFADRGLGAILYYNPSDLWYASIGIVDAQADARETGFNTAFTDEDYFFTIAEAGVTPDVDLGNGPQQGAYRVGVWLDGTPRVEFTGGNEQGDMGAYVSFDQDLTADGLAVFGRFGYADNDVTRNGGSTVANFYSIGVQQAGIIDGRDDDVVGLGFSQGIFSNRAGLAEDNETVTELYYNAMVNDKLSLSPSIQYVASPGGTSGNGDAIVLALRAQMSF